MKRKSMTKAEFDEIMKKDLVPIEVLSADRPNWAKGIPDEKLFAVFASGSADTPATLQNVPNQVGGFDIFRNAEPIDRVNYNRDHYMVVLDPSNENQLWVLGPYKADPKRPEEKHHTDDLPAHLQVARINAP